MAKAPEFSRPVVIDRIGRDGAMRRIEASASERHALAKRLGLVSLGRLVARVEVTPGPRSTSYRVACAIEARVVQSCIVSLEPVETQIADHHIQLFIASPGPQSKDVDAGSADDEVAEIIIDGQIDLGELAAQQLALALPDYPRAPEATVAAVARSLPGDVSLCIESENLASAAVDLSSAGAFAALARLKGK
ncbi:MAG: DUF177 domain-containing protein [Alphaproteobacteria bacterium]|nr:DUF177 domain-containing protein [Alphaproteobacteria bacterium]